MAESPPSSSIVPNFFPAEISFSSILSVLTDNYWIIAAVIVVVAFLASLYSNYRLREEVRTLREMASDFGCEGDLCSGPVTPKAVSSLAAAKKDGPKASKGSEEAPKGSEEDYEM